MCRIHPIVPNSKCATQDKPRNVTETIEDILAQAAASIPFVYSLGFKQITGVNLAEGDFNWDDDELIRNFIVQLEQLKHFYLKNPQYKKKITIFLDNEVID